MNSGAWLEKRLGHWKGDRPLECGVWMWFWNESDVLSNLICFFVFSGKKVKFFAWCLAWGNVSGDQLILAIDSEGLLIGWQVMVFEVLVLSEVC